MVSSAEALFGLLEDLFVRKDVAEFERYCVEVLGQVEREHFDYKWSASTDGKLHDDDKRNLGKALSGFANASGGVLIWGMREERGGVGLAPIPKVEKFAGAMMQLAGQATEPAVEGLRVATLHSADGSGFACLLVPESQLPPHQVLLTGDAHRRYYGRSGSSFIHLSHSTLADLFGRRPQPVLRVVVRDFVVVRTMGGALNGLSMTVENSGRGNAKNLAMSVWCECQGQVHEVIPQGFFSLIHRDPHGRGLFATTSSILHAGWTMKVDGMCFRGLVSGERVVVHVRLFADGIRPVEQTFEVNAAVGR
jgi:hypothetical protein